MDYLKNDNYDYYSAGDISEKEWQQIQNPERGEIIVIDDVHKFSCADDCQGKMHTIAKELSENKDVWLILAGRCPLPSWLSSAYVCCGFVLTSEQELMLSEREIAQYLRESRVQAGHNTIRKPFRECEISSWIIWNTVFFQSGSRIFGGFS